jgi:hypothetical protein
MCVCMFVCGKWELKVEIKICGTYLNGSGLAWLLSMHVFISADQDRDDPKMAGMLCMAAYSQTIILIWPPPPRRFPTKICSVNTQWQAVCESRAVLAFLAFTFPLYELVHPCSPQFAASSNNFILKINHHKRKRYWLIFGKFAQQHEQGMGM